MRISVIVVSWNVSKLLNVCLQTLRRDLENIESEVFVVDNASADDSVEMVRREHSWVKLIANDKNLGFAAGNNQAIRQATGEYIFLLNPDTEIIPGAVPGLIEFLEQHPKAGIVAPQLINSDGSIQRSCRKFPTFLGMLYELLGLSKMFPDHPLFGSYKMLDFNHDVLREVDQPEGACLLLRCKVIEEVGILDEGFFMLFEEVDWCYRIKQAGWEIWFDPSCRVVHHYGQSIKQVKARMILSSHRGLYRFWSKHYARGRWYLYWFVYSGLMVLAYMRIVSHSLRKPSSVGPS